MSNPANAGIVIGRLAADPKFIAHSNGKSGTALLTVYSQNNYVTKSTGERESVRVDLEDFIADSNNVGPYSFLKKGMLVAVNYSIGNKDYTDKQGNQHYGMKLVVERGGIQILESRGAVAQRENRAAQTDNAGTQDQAQAMPQPGIGEQAGAEAQAPAQTQTFAQAQSQDAPF